MRLHRRVRLEVGDGLFALLRAGLLKLAAGAERVELGVASADGQAVEALALVRGDFARAVRVGAPLLVADPEPVVLVVDGVDFPVEIPPEDVDVVLEPLQRSRLPKDRLEDLIEEWARSRGGGGLLLLLAAVARSKRWNRVSCHEDRWIIVAARHAKKIAEQGTVADKVELGIFEDY